MNMANEERQEKLTVAGAQLAALADVDARALARTSALSPDINFRETVPYFSEMLDLCKQLNQARLIPPHTKPAQRSVGRLHAT